MQTLMIDAEPIVQRSARVQIPAIGVLIDFEFCKTFFGHRASNGAVLFQDRV
jgi:hypothetical protein